MTVLDLGPGGGTVRYEDDGDLVLAARAGDRDAFGTLFDRWFDRVHDVAYRILRDRELAAEVAQDVFLVGWTHLNGIEQPASFGGWLLRTARNRALNRLERERRSVAVSDEETVMQNRHEPESDPGERLHRAEQVDLVWAAAAALGERDASVLDLHLRHSLGPAELAETLGVTVNNAHQLLFRLRKRLAAAVQGWVLWRGGEPACRELAEVLAAAGITTFGPAAVTQIARHSADCDGCTSRREQRLAPEAMFAAVPIIAVAPLVKAEAASALEAAGVPMQGSSALGGEPPASGRHGPRRHRRVRLHRFHVLASVAVVLVVATTILAAEAVDDAQQPADSATAPTTTGPSTTEPGPGTTTSTSTTDPVSTTTTSQPTTTTTAPTASTATTTPPPRPTSPPPDDGTTTTAPPAADPPEIGGFRVVTQGQPCPDSNDLEHTATWSTTGATSASVGYIGGPTAVVPVSGTRTICAPRRATFELAVTGPGGKASDTATAT